MAASWSDLDKRLNRLYDDADEAPEIVSDLSDGRGTRFYRLSAFEELEQWLIEARRLAVAEERHRIEEYLEEIVEKYSEGRLDFARMEAEGLDWNDFEWPRDIDKDDGIADPLNARYRFQLMLEELLLRSRMWASDPLPKREAAARTPEVPDVVSVEQATKLIQGQFGTAYKAATIRNWYYMAAKQSPTGKVAWAERLPEGKRGFRIKWPEFWAYFRSGSLPPKQPRRSAGGTGIAARVGNFPRRATGIASIPVRVLEFARAHSISVRVTAAEQPSSPGSTTAMAPHDSRVSGKRAAGSIGTSETPPICATRSGTLIESPSSWGSWTGQKSGAGRACGGGWVVTSRRSSAIFRPVMKRCGRDGRGSSEHERDGEREHQDTGIEAIPVARRGKTATRRTNPGATCPRRTSQMKTTILCAALSLEAIPEPV